MTEKRPTTPAPKAYWCGLTWRDYWAFYRARWDGTRYYRRAQRARSLAPH